MSREVQLQYPHVRIHWPGAPPVSDSRVLTARGAVHIRQLKQLRVHLWFYQCGFRTPYGWETSPTCCLHSSPCCWGLRIGSSDSTSIRSPPVYILDIVSHGSLRSRGDVLVGIESNSHGVIWGRRSARRHRPPRPGLPSSSKYPCMDSLCSCMESRATLLGAEESRMLLGSSGRGGWYVENRNVP